MKGIAYILLLVAIASCNPVKKVLQNKADYEQIGKAWAEEHPCANDTVEKVIPGGVDTILVPFKVIDEDLMRHKTDIVTKELQEKYHYDQTACDSAVRESYNVGFQQAALIASNIKIPIKLPDTIVRVVVDTRERDLLQKDKSNLLNQVIDLKGKVDKANQQKTIAYMWTSIIGLLFIILLILYFKK